MANNRYDELREMARSIYPDSSDVQIAALVGDFDSVETQMLHKLLAAFERTTSARELSALTLKVVKLVASIEARRIRAAGEVREDA